MLRSGDFHKVAMPMAGRGDLAGLRSLLEERPSWLQHRGSHGRTLLWEAAWRGKLEVVRALAEAGADIESPGCHFTPLYVEVTPYCAARVKRRQEVAEYLLSRGAEINVHTAAYLGDTLHVAALVDSDPARLDLRCPQHSPSWRPAARPGPGRSDALYATPLCYAVSGRQTETAQWLVKRGAEVREHSWHLLHYSGKDVELLRLLLENGADASVVGSTQTDTDEAGRLLRSYGVPVDPDAKLPWGWPPLVYICRGDRGGKPDEVRRLLELGADVGARNAKGKTALHVAAKSGFVPAMTVLLEHGADVEAADSEGQTPLFDAIQSTIKRIERKLECVGLLLDSGADPGAVDRKGRTPVRVARASRRPEAKDIQRLLEDPRT